MFELWVELGFIRGDKFELRVELGFIRGDKKASSLISDINALP